MSLVALVIQLAVVGLVVWMIVTYIPMPKIFKKAIPVVTGIALILYLLQVFGLLGEVNSIRVGPVR